MHKTNEEAAKANHKYMKDVSSVFRQRMDSLVDLELEVTRLMTVLITKTQQVADMKRQLDFFMLGIHRLIQRRLSPYLVPEMMLRKALSDVENILRRRHPDFML